MKTLLTICLLGLIVSVGCNKAPSETMKKTVIVSLDDAHNHAAGTNAVFYAIEPCESIALDSTGYSVPVSAKLGVSAPNAVHVIRGDEYFRIGWDGKSSIILNASSLTKVRGKASFSGFHLGEEYLIGIGHDNFPDPALKFEVMWVGTVKVKLDNGSHGESNQSPASAR